MIVLFSACVLFGCMQDVPVVITDDPVRYRIEQVFKSQKTVDTTPKACYIDGVFHKTCPQ